jgi:hypothetical protein
MKWSFWLEIAFLQAKAQPGIHLPAGIDRQYLYFGKYGDS